MKKQKNADIKNIITKTTLGIFVLFTMLFALFGCMGMGDGGKSNEIVIMVPGADHGWTGAVVEYAKEKAQEINDGGEYKARVLTSQDSQNQISQLEDLVESGGCAGIVILPQDNQLTASMKSLSSSGIPFVMFDRIITDVKDSAVTSVRGDNEGVGASVAERFLLNGLEKGDKILIMAGDNSSVSEERTRGFYETLRANGFTEEDLKNISTTDYTNWSRSKSKELFASYLDSNSVSEIGNCRYIYTHDDEIALGIIEALKGSDIDPNKKEAFLSVEVCIASAGGLNEMYSAIKGIHQKDYGEITSRFADLVSVTYDPAMIKIAVDDMVKHLSGESVTKEHVVPTEIVYKDNVDEYRGFGDAVSK